MNTTTEGTTSVTEPISGNVPSNPETDKPALTINDLANLRAIIEVATQRGAFRAAELAGVGAIYDKLDSFIKSIPPAPAAKA
jgi:hypothetical protein